VSEKTVFSFGKKKFYKNCNFYWLKKTLQSSTIWTSSSSSSSSLLASSSFGCLLESASLALASCLLTLRSSSANSSCSSVEGPGLSAPLLPLEGPASDASSPVASVLHALSPLFTSFGSVLSVQVMRFLLRLRFLGKVTDATD
jgi:hypothetical protein